MRIVEFLVRFAVERPELAFWIAVIAFAAMGWFRRAAQKSARRPSLRPEQSQHSPTMMSTSTEGANPPPPPRSPREAPSATREPSLFETIRRQLEPLPRPVEPASVKVTEDRVIRLRTPEARASETTSQAAARDLQRTRDASRSRNRKAKIPSAAHRLLSKRGDLRRAIIAHEILGKPRALSDFES